MSATRCGPTQPPQSRYVIREALGNLNQSWSLPSNTKANPQEGHGDQFVACLCVFLVERATGHQLPERGNADEFFFQSMGQSVRKDSQVAF
ncbi:MAG: hypothetical protein RIS58_804 [Actinomycetota bacterium]